MATRQGYAAAPGTPDEPDYMNDPTLAYIGDSVPTAPSVTFDGGNGGQGTPAPAPTAAMPPPTGAPPPAATPTPAFTPAAGAPSFNTINSLFQTDLGRPISEADYETYFGGGNGAIDPNYATSIYNSPEAQKYRASQMTAPLAPTKPSAPPNMPNVDVPLGNAVDAGLEGLIGSQGMTPQESSLLDTIQGIIGAGGALPGDQNIEQQQLEQARESESGAFTSQLNDARDELANRGLVSEPGVPQGTEGEAIDTISRNLAPSYAQSVQAIQTNQAQLRESRLQSAIATATGLDENAAGNLLQATGQGSSRQIGLAQIALDSLSQDMSWNEFLANYGLNRDQVMASIQNGNISSLMTLLTLYEQTAQTSSTGHI